MEKTYEVTVFNTVTGKYEKVSVSKEVYHAFMRTGWNIKDNNETALIMRHSLLRSTIRSAPFALNEKGNLPRTKVTSSLINSRNCRASWMNMSRQKPSTRICSIRSLKRQS